MKIENLEKCFFEANNKDKKYVGVLIQMEGFIEPEVIINKNVNFDSKFAYYKKAYDENLTLRSFNGIKIIGFTSGNSFSDIEKDLITGTYMDDDQSY